MVKYLLSFILLFPVQLFGQGEIPGIQNEWVQDLKSGNVLSAYNWEQGYLLFGKVEVNHVENISALLQEKKLSGIKGYVHIELFRHDENRYISVGELETESGTYMLLSGWRKLESDWKKEMDVILRMSETKGKPEQTEELLNQQRKDWVKLANQHNPEIHIRNLYTPDAVYFGNGRRSDGHDGIADRYFYMENPDYQVDLKKEQLWLINEENVLEVGRYFTGPVKSGPGGLYTILWEKQAETKGDWLIAFDFNF